MAKVCGRGAQKSVLPCFIQGLLLPGDVALYGIWEITVDLDIGDSVPLACTGNALKVLVNRGNSRNGQWGMSMDCS